MLKKNMPINENNNIAPINPYAATKAYQIYIQIIIKVLTKNYYYKNVFIHKC